MRFAGGRRARLPVVRAAARQVLGVEHRPAEGAVDEQIGVAADDEFLSGRELADAQFDVAGQVLLDPRLNSRTVGGASTLLTSIRLSRLAPLNWLPKMLWMLAWNFAPTSPR